MSNKASNQLFLLIHSMSKQEKRYFKLFSARHSNEGNQYYTLYQCLARLETYDESEVLIQLKGHPIARRLSIAKTRLYDQLLKSLSAFHAQKSISSELFGILQGVEVLYNRAMYKAAWKKWHSGMKLATKNEQYGIMQSFYHWQHRLIEKENYEKWNLEKLEAIRSDEKTTLKKMDVLQNLWHLKSQMFTQLFYQGMPRKRDIKNLQKEWLKQLKSIPTSLMNKRGRFLKQHIESALFYASGHFEHAYKYLKSNLKLMDESPGLFGQSPEQRLAILSNMAFMATKLKLKNEGVEWLKQLAAYRLSGLLEDEASRVRWFYSFYSLYFSGLISEAWEKVEEISDDDLAADFENYLEKLPVVRKLDLVFIRSVHEYRNHNLRSALRSIHGVINEMNPRNNIHLYFAARFYYLILLWEMDKLDYLAVAWASTRRLLHTRNYNTHESKAIALLMGHLAKGFNGNETEQLEILHTTLKPLKYRPLQVFFDFGRWAQYKLDTSKVCVYVAS